MLRGLMLALLVLHVSACSGMLDSVQRVAESRIQQMLGRMLGERLTAGIDWVIDNLAAEGGFLDDPLVRIVMPPPLGLMLDVVRDLRSDPKAALLETLMNRAAESAIPVAGPLLRELVVNLDQETLVELVEAPDQAATDYLKEKGGAVIQQALLPAVTENLIGNGAVELYSELLQAHQQQEVAAAGIETPAGEIDVVESVAPEQLANYVAEQAVGGLFRKMAVKEQVIRDELARKVELPF